MKILMLASGTPHSSLTHRIVALGAELVRAGHTVTIAAPRHDKHSRWQLDQPASINGVRFIYPFQFKNRSLLLNLAPYIMSVSWHVIAGRPDLVYIYKPTPLTIPGLLAKLLRRTPVVTDLDDLGSEVMRIEGQSGLVWQLTAWCEQLATRHANGLVVASRLLKQEVSAAHPRKPVIILSNGVNPNEFQPAHAKPRPQPHLVFFGLLSRASIMQPVLEAVAQVVNNPQIAADVQLDIMGDGSVRGQLEAQAEALGISHRVRFWGWTSYDQFRDRAFPQDIAICVMPDERTTAACSNQKVFQYQAMRLVPIVSRVGDLPLYAQEGKAGLIVAPGDTAGLAAALTSVLSDAPLRRRLSAASAQLAEHTYSWQNLGSQLVEFMESLT